MKVLIVSSRSPRAQGLGDQQRVFVTLEQLLDRHSFTVIASHPLQSEKEVAAVRSLAELKVVPASKLRRAASALAAAVRGQPMQTGWMMPGRTWREVVRCAPEFDVVLASTVRSVRGPVGTPLVIDHVDALSQNMSIRGRGPGPFPIRILARFESWRLRRWEEQVAGWASAQVATTALDAGFLPVDPPMTVIPAAYRGEILEESPDDVRDIDVIFTGGMGYSLNRDAVNWLVKDILPLVRQDSPKTNAWVVGRAADRLYLDGVETASDVPDMTAYLRRAKVAVVPLRATGSPYKVLEAAASGAALVANRAAVECYGMPALVAESSEDFASAILTLLNDESLRRRLASEALPVVQSHSVAVAAGKLETVLKAVAGHRQEPSP